LFWFWDHRAMPTDRWAFLHWLPYGARAVSNYNSTASVGDGHGDRYGLARPRPTLPPMSEKARPRITTLDEFDKASRALYDNGLSVDEAMIRLLTENDIAPEVIAGALVRTAGLGADRRPGEHAKD
jgi:hypothetical protein